jgi:glutaredoxin-related protein
MTNKKILKIKQILEFKIVNLLHKNRRRLTIKHSSHDTHPDLYVYHYI